jgi:hypothetical protein
VQRLKRLRELVERLFAWSKRREAPTETESLLTTAHTHTHKVDDSSRPTQNHGNTETMPKDVRGKKF